MSGSGITPVTPPNNASAPNKGVVVQIVSLPDALQNNVRALRLEGEVVQQNKDGSVRIRTPEGDIDVQVRGRQPQAGQRMEVDIPAGSPPRNATVRNAPAQPAPQQPAQPTPQPNVPLPQTPVTQPSQPPVQGQPPLATKPGAPQHAPSNPPADLPDVFQPAPQPATAQKPLPSLPPLQPGQIVKLVAAAAPVLQPPPESTIIQKASAQATMIAQKSEGNLVTTLLNAVKSVLPQSIAPQTPTILPQTQNTPAQAQTLLQQPLTLAAKVISLTLPSGQTLALPQSTPALTAPTPVISLTAPTPQATIQAPVAPSTLTITVAEVTPQNQPVISVPVNDKGGVQNFVLQSPPASVPVGTQITLQPQIIQQQPQTQMTASTTLMVQTPDAGTMPAPVMATPALTPSTPVSALPPAWRAILPLMQPSTLWPVMDDLFQTFYQATPQAAQIMGRVIPSPSNGGNFGPALMLFAAALKSGDLQAWIGDRKLDMLQKLGKQSTLSRLSGETASLAGSNDIPATEWKSFPVPLLWQNEISKVLFHVRKEPSENEKEQGEGGTRFVMDLELTRMGGVQLDGLVRGKQLDLVVRTQMPVSSPMQDAMRTAYAKALDGTDIFGDIGFQSDVKNWIQITARENALASV